MKNQKKLTFLFLYGAYVFLFIFLFFAVCEIVSRLKYTPQKIDHEWIFDYDKDKKFRLKKNFTGEFFKTHVRTNAQGFRDNEIAVKKPAGVKRIFVLGDSVTFGHGVAAHQTYPEKFESLLNHQNKSWRFEVLNMGIPGNSA